VAYVWLGRNDMTEERKIYPEAIPAEPMAYSLTGLTPATGETGGYLLGAADKAENRAMYGVILFGAGVNPNYVYGPSGDAGDYPGSWTELLTERIGGVIDVSFYLDKIGFRAAGKPRVKKSC